MGFDKALSRPANTERRRHKRFRLRPGALAICAKQLVGSVQDIGLGGLSFTYLPEENGVPEAGDVDIVLGASASRLTGYAMVPVCDRPAALHDPACASALHRCGAAFAGISPEGRRLLERFIQANAAEAA